MNRRHHPVSLQQATQESPTLARLTAQASDSVSRLKSVEVLIPVNLRAMIQPGPIDGQTWCLLIKGNAAAAKVRQLMPAMLAHLRTKGWDVVAIRLKIQT